MGGFYSNPCICISRFNFYLKHCMYCEILCAFKFVPLDMNGVKVGVTLTRQFIFKLILQKVFEEFMNNE